MAEARASALAEGGSRLPLPSDVPYSVVRVLRIPTDRGVGGDTVASFIRGDSSASSFGVYTMDQLRGWQWEEKLLKCTDRPVV